LGPRVHSEPGGRRATSGIARGPLGPFIRPQAPSEAFTKPPDLRAVPD
jgi:hypothetical protein